MIFLENGFIMKTGEYKINFERVKNIEAILSIT